MNLEATYFEERNVALDISFAFQLLCKLQLASARLSRNREVIRTWQAARSPSNVLWYDLSNKFWPMRRRRILALYFYVGEYIVFADESLSSVGCRITDAQCYGFSFSLLNLKGPQSWKASGVKESIFVSVEVRGHASVPKSWGCALKWILGRVTMTLGPPYQPPLHLLHSSSASSLLTLKNTTPSSTITQHQSLNPFDLLLWKFRWQTIKPIPPAVSPAYSLRIAYLHSVSTISKLTHPIY